MLLTRYKIFQFSPKHFGPAQDNFRPKERLGCFFLNFHASCITKILITYDFKKFLAKLCTSKGQEISKAIFEIINFPKFDPKNLKDFCPMYFRAGILQISRVKFWKIDDFKNCFRDLLTFRRINIYKKT